MSKICMLVTNSVRKDPRVRKEAMTAVENGFEVTVIGIADQNTDFEFNRSVPYKIVLVPFLKNDYRRNSPKWFLTGLKKQGYYKNKMIEAVLQEMPDTIHCNDFDTLEAGYAVKKKLNCKLVYDSHEVATGSFLAEKFPPVKFYIKKKEGKIIRKADIVISVSNSAADYISSLYRVPRPTVITNCPNYHEPVNAEPPKQFDVLYQGIMSPGRGYEEFVEAAKYLDPKLHHLTIRGYGETKDALIRMTESLGVTDRVTFASPVEISELISAAAGSSAGVVLTRPVCVNYAMTVSNKLFEYIQARIPVILSDVPEHRYLNEKYRFGVILPEVTPEAIANAVTGLASDPDRYAELKKNVLLAAKELCWESFEKELIRIYKA